MTNLKVASKDVAPARRQGGEIRALLTPTSVGATAGFLGTLTLDGHEHVAEHYHPYSDEFLFVVRGTLTVTVEDHSVVLDSGESLMVPRGARHRMLASAGRQVFAVFHIAPLAPRPELGHVDTEQVPHPEQSVPRVGHPAQDRGQDQ